MVSITQLSYNHGFIFDLEDRQHSPTVKLNLTIPPLIGWRLQNSLYLITVSYKIIGMIIIR